MKVTETFTDILNYYILQTTANKFAVYVKVYAIKKYWVMRVMLWLVHQAHGQFFFFVGERTRVPERVSGENVCLDYEVDNR